MIRGARAFCHQCGALLHGDERQLGVCDSQQSCDDRAALALGRAQREHETAIIKGALAELSASYGRRAESWLRVQVALATRDRWTREPSVEHLAQWTAALGALSYAELQAFCKALPAGRGAGLKFLLVPSLEAVR